MAESYRDLIAWQKSMDFVVEVYSVTRRFPKEELYGLTNQLRRAACSVPSNIAEGKGRFSKREFAQFLSRARGSLLETETQIMIAERLAYVDQEIGETLLAKSNEIGRILNGLMSAVKRSFPES